MELRPFRAEPSKRDASIFLMTGKLVLIRQVLTQNPNMPPGCLFKPDADLIGLIPSPIAINHPCLGLEIIVTDFEGHLETLAFVDGEFRFYLHAAQTDIDGFRDLLDAKILVGYQVGEFETLVSSAIPFNGFLHALPTPSIVGFFQGTG